MSSEGNQAGMTANSAEDAGETVEQASNEATPRRIHLRDITAETPLDVDVVGAVLRTARLKTGEDLKSVSDCLRIRRVYLEALEESRHEDLPGRAYAIGFVRTYAGYLGFNATEMVERYKRETEPETLLVSASRGDGFAFPEVRQEARLPRGSLFILAVLLGAGVYGAWLLSISADRMVTERTQPTRENAGIVADVANPNALATPSRALPGDSASAATSNGALPSVNQPVRPAAQSGSAAVTTAPVSAPEAASAAASAATAIVETTPAPVEAQAAETEVAALTPVTPPAPQAVTDAPIDEAATDTTPIATDLSLVMGGARVYGLENEGSRVVVRATKSAWLRIEAGDGTVLLNETLNEGEMYRAPVSYGAILVARDAGAFELFVDGSDIGPAGPSGLVLTGKSLNPDDLLRR